MNLPKVSLALVATLGLIHAQSPTGPEFEVASVRPANPNVDLIDNHLPTLNANQGRITFTNIQLRNLIMLAYGIGKGQITAPDSLARSLTSRYDVVAKLPANATREQVPLMLQRLLAERFKVTLHRDNKVMLLYALVVAGNALKLKDLSNSASGESGCNRSFATTPGASLAADCHGMTAADIALAVTALAPGYFDRPVVDGTGLKGLYDFKLEWIMRAESLNGNNGPTIFAAVEQLGLKLEARKQAMDILVIDHAENAPTEN